MMNIRTYLLLFLIVTISNNLKAQNYIGSISFKGQEFRKKGDSLELNMQMHIRAQVVESRETIHIVPQVYKPLGKQLSLPIVEINGQNRQRMEERSSFLQRNRNQNRLVYARIGVNQMTDTIIHYRHIFAYEKWMDQAQFILRQENERGKGKHRGIFLIQDAGNNSKGNTETTLLQKILLKGYGELNEHDVNAPIPKEGVYTTEYSKSTVNNSYTNDSRGRISGAIYMDFRVNNTDIQPEYQRNPKELSRLRDTLSAIYANPKYRITSLYIRGTASPDGPITVNETLSRGRAYSFRDYLLRYMGLYLPDKDVHMEWVGEDWQGLAKLLDERPNFPYRNQLLYLIRRVPLHEGREQLLSELDGGKAYALALRELFPLLCKVEYKIEYQEIND
ncbi:hypothetical protein CMT37_18500 [Elizabethkingia anophelis]|nr:hypothetical protein [Elizabethkingia anophelis]